MGFALVSFSSSGSWSRPRSLPMTKYVMYMIENEGRLWVLRRFGRHGTVASGATLESIREQAFGRLRGFAPCSFQISGSAPEEWRLESDDGQWEHAEPGTVNPRSES